ncbi:MAG TPA: hypothetical protein VLV83_18270 [Acidobacteriota bacterium]|nr:hypothetical protein [Acidobacteriota bacterium]
MREHKLTFATALLMTLAVLCFSTGQAWEVAHPLEEGWQAEHGPDHQHASQEGLQEVCGPAHVHDHHCLHQQSLAPHAEPPSLAPILQRRTPVGCSPWLPPLLTSPERRPRSPPAPLST